MTHIKYRIEDPQKVQAPITLETDIPDIPLEVDLPSPKIYANFARSMNQEIWVQ